MCTSLSLGDYANTSFPSWNDKVNYHNRDKTTELDSDFETFTFTWGEREGLMSRRKKEESDMFH
jgi:hypothetical protein